MEKEPLIGYIRDGYGKIHGTVVAVAPDKIGVSFVNPKDQCIKRAGVKIAKERAISGYETQIPNRVLPIAMKMNMTAGWPLAAVTQEAIDHMKYRASKYFVSQSVEKE